MSVGLRFKLQFYCVVSNEYEKEAHIVATATTTTLVPIEYLRSRPEDDRHPSGSRITNSAPGSRSIHGFDRRVSRSTTDPMKGSRLRRSRHGLSQTVWVPLTSSSQDSAVQNTAHCVYPTGVVAYDANFNTLTAAEKAEPGRFGLSASYLRKDLLMAT
ncbi:hypothetical protein BWQ96_08317 [Gracilariopsis chorda]|uniref:Uncharacterized protein n=1 Tax=Gracilariopsis chorda TaxID=448386 RepID=A0A2V3IIV7_9FLOR|nr:hypothetical protein BWQ96_08317 [Gracilariopsis chorda]|eukprot:PXF41963.1 hypothetical protein BWQ96_08317 [Gracilariopsis chorda]